MEISTRWTKSSYSGTNNNCVEVAPTPTVVGVRDTKDRAAGYLAVTPRSWSAFLTEVASREY